MSRVWGQETRPSTLVAVVNLPDFGRDLACTVSANDPEVAECRSMDGVVVGRGRDWDVLCQWEM